MDIENTPPSQPFPLDPDFGPPTHILDGLVLDDASTSANTDETTNNQQIQLTKDSLYYLDTIVFQVEDCFFKVPKYHFTKGTDHFTPLFSSFNPDGNGDDDASSIELDGVSKIEFRDLLKLLYPPSPGETSLSPQEWVSVLKLASKWMMLDLRDMAIRNITPAKEATSIDKIILARKYGISAWLRAGYLELVERPENLSVDDALELGLDSALKICRTREQLFQQFRQTYESSYGGRAASNGDVGDYGAAIDREFEEELREAQVMAHDAIDRVILARTYGVAKWLRSAYLELAEREKSITFEEAERLGLESTIGICRVRGELLESYRQKVRNHGMYCTVDFARAVDERFEKELSDIRVLETPYIRTAEPDVACTPSLTQDMRLLGGKKKKKKK